MILWLNKNEIVAPDKNDIVAPDRDHWRNGWLKVEAG